MARALTTRGSTGSPDRTRKANSASIRGSQNLARWVATAAAPSLSAVAGQGRLLIMDDEPAIRDISQRMLRKAGYRVVSLRKHGYPRSKLFPLFLNVLAVPLENPPELAETRVERCVPVRRKLAMLRRRVLSRLLPRRAWLPLEG